MGIRRASTASYSTLTLDEPDDPPTRFDSGFGLVDAFGVDAGDVVSLVGAGGKTTVLYALATELRRRRGLSVITTSTTHMQLPSTGETMPPLVVLSEEDNWLTTVKARLARYGSVTVIQECRSGTTS